MCDLCDIIYTEDMYGTEKDHRDFQGGIYIKKYQTDYSTNTYYEIRSTRLDTGDKYLLSIKYCPDCGKQLFFDNYYHGTVLKNPKVKIIKVGE